jgi:peptide/nickel transport system permease protein
LKWEHDELVEYSVRRLLFSLVSIAGILLITFFALRIVPGDAALILLDQEATPEAIAKLRNELGLDLPVHKQLYNWIWSLIHGDLGRSYRTGIPVISELVKRYSVTIELAFAATLIAVLIGIPIGIISATKRNSVFDFVSRTFALLGISVPNFWLALLLILMFSLAIKILPTGGYVSLTENMGANLKSLIMPAFALGIAMAAVLMRMMRSTLLDALSRDYIRTARAKGVRERAVVFGHALRNSLIPVITVIGLQLGHALGGAVIVEEIFSWPGVGRLIVHGIYQRDYPVVQGGVLALAISFVFLNLFVDILYGYIDPRIKYD